MGRRNLPLVTEELADAMPQMVFLSDAKGSPLFYNKRWYEYTGQGPDALGTKIWAMVIHPEDLARIEATWRRACQSGEGWSCEYRVRRKDGVYRWHLGRSVPVRDEAGALEKWIGTVTDIEDRKKTEEELERAHDMLMVERENFRNLFEETSDIVCILSGPEHFYEYVNSAHVKALGYNAMGKRARDIHPDSDELNWILDQVYESGSTMELHEVEVPVGTHRRYFNVTYSARRNERGKVDGIIALGTDITSQVLARRELEHSTVRLAEVVRERTSELSDSRAFLFSLIENLPNMVFVKDSRELRFVRINRAGEELLGLRRGDLIGKNDYDFFPKEQADFFISKDRAVLSGHEIVDIPEEVIQTRHHGERILHTKKIPIFGADGKPEFLLGISEDITESKRSQRRQVKMAREQAAFEERERSTRKTTFLADASTILASSLDYYSTLQRLAKLAVPAIADWCTVSMLKEDERTIERVAAVHADPNRSALVEELKAMYPDHIEEAIGVGSVVRSGQSILADELTDFALSAFARDERHLELMRALGCYSCMVVPIRSRDRIHGAITLVYEKPSRKYHAEDLALAEELGRRAGTAIENALLFESAQKAVHSRDDFLSIASHELKTPLTSLKLQLQMTRKNVKVEQGIQPSPERLARVLDIATIQVNRLAALIDDLLDVSRIQAGKLTYSFESTDLNEVVREMAERFSEQLSAAHCKLEIEAHEPVYASCDRFRMEQVVINLLSNAAKYGSGKPVKIEVNRHNGAARIVVRDHGMGIPKEKLDKIFERFERAVTSDNISGLGLGLFISREIVKAHHGSIHVESELGHGSAFIVDLPAVGK